MTKRVIARAVTAICATTLVAGMAAAQPASAAPIQLTNWDANVKTHVAGLVGQDVQIPAGKFSATVDLTTKQMTAGVLDLPATTFSYNLFGIIPVTVTYHVDQTAPITGTVDLATGQITARDTFDIRLSAVNLFGFLPILDPATTCKTTTPTTADLSGTFTVTDGAVMTGSYTIPPLAGCGSFEGIVSGVTAGPGNTLDVSVKPPAA